MGLIRLFLKHLSDKLFLKINNLKSGNLIRFLVSLALTGVFGYGMVYNWTDFPHLSGLQIIGLLVMSILFLLFLSSTIRYGAVLRRPAGRKRAAYVEDRIKEDPFLRAMYIGETIFNKRKCTVYKQDGKFILKSGLKTPGFTEYIYGSFRLVDVKELGNVYRWEKHCYYKGRDFGLYTVHGCFRPKTVSILTFNLTMDEVTKLGFKQVNRGEFEIKLPYKEVKIKEEKVRVDLQEEAGE